MTAKEKQVLKALCKKSYYQFFLEFWETVVPDPLQVNWHIEYLCDELQRVGERVIQRLPKEYDLVINVPPGESKSTIATVLFNAWIWTIDPSIRILSGSYSGDLAMEHAVKTKDCIKSEKYQAVFGDTVVIRKDEDNKKKYQTTKGGVRNPFGFNGTVTGKHGHIIIIDDPINPKQADSKTLREGAIQVMDKTLPTRKVDAAITPTIVIMQRLAENDPTGHLLKKAKDEGKPIKHICLPANDEFPIYPEELSNKYQDGIMNPLRKSKAVLAQMKIDLGSVGFAAQLGQQPVPTGGNMVQGEDFQQYDKFQLLKEIEAFRQAQANGEGKKRRGQKKHIEVCFYIDSAYTKKTKNDPTVILAYVEFNHKLYLLHRSKVRMEFPELVKHIKAYIKKHGYSDQSKIYIEPKASGKSLAQTLKSEGINAIEDNPPTDDKVTRLAATSPKIEAGFVYVPIGEVWVEDFIAECELFPYATHDDQVDCLTGAIRNSIMRDKGRRRN